jgi:hypothetical protein
MGPCRNRLENYGGKTCDIATSLIQLDEIGFDENSPYV